MFISELQKKVEFASNPLLPFFFFSINEHNDRQEVFHRWNHLWIVKLALISSVDIVWLSSVKSRGKFIFSRLFNHRSRFISLDRTDRGKEHSRRFCRRPRCFFLENQGKKNSHSTSIHFQRNGDSRKIDKRKTSPDSPFRSVLQPSLDAFRRIQCYHEYTLSRQLWWIILRS